MRRLTRYLLLSFLPTLLATGAQEDGLSAQELRQLMQMAEYISVDYPEAVRGGEVVNDAEYAEMREFSQLIEDNSARLAAPPEADAVREEATALRGSGCAAASPEDTDSNRSTIRYPAQSGVFFVCG
ncbi:hypothetical protein [Microbulbifer halophilus]|uniref:Uncharacterized protein n=1 Tax=Microbulbifer halophilus TaxID=453963 RepID=A0ABW5EFX3_9GAMM|nr:hypothetical protein [Microbulbifer halophilus]MCW8128620.1 hypothetical protein [Microbulbifer halophilus]